jgi:hypothetical protein
LRGDRAHRKVKDAIRKTIGFKDFTPTERIAYAAALRAAIAEALS